MKPSFLKTPNLGHSIEVDASSLILYYLEQLNIEYVFGIPGGAIEPFYNALAVSERQGGPKSVVARHETGAVFMADGYARNSGKLGVCCATTGPGSTNLITGVASAHENQVPLLVITAQTSLRNFGRRAFQDSADTGINIVGMMQHCTRYNSMVTHVDQLEQKLVKAIMTAMMPPYGPVHLSIPTDILKSRLTLSTDTYELPKLVTQQSFLDTGAVDQFMQMVAGANKTAFVLGAGAAEAAPHILTLASQLNAALITTPDGKGLVSPQHPLYRGVIGFAGHSSASDTLRAPDLDLVVAVGTIISEWSSNGWDRASLLNKRMIHIDAVPDNLIHTPMAGLHVLGRPRAVFERVLEAGAEAIGLDESDSAPKPLNNDSETLFTMDDADAQYDESSPIKPQWLMRELSETFPPHTKFFADTGNSLAWAIHYLHPFDRRISERRQRDEVSFGRRKDRAGLFQCAIEFASMGWAIGNAIGAALANRGNPVVCITGDGSLLMNGQEIGVAAQHELPVVFVVLNDGALGMVKHGQRLAEAESIGFELPATNFAMLAESMGVEGIRVESPEDLRKVDFSTIKYRRKPLLLDVVIDGDQVPPIRSRIDILNNFA